MSDPRPGFHQGRDGLWYPPYPDCDYDLVAETSQEELEFHVGPQDTESEAWALLLQLVDAAADDGREVFSPGAEIPRQFWPEIVTLPATIAKLTVVRELELYGSHLISIPPEIGQMSSLRSLDPYTSRRLHWLPYEITRCAELSDSRISTRHLYGNFKNRLPFPRLPTKLPAGSTPKTCSVCDGPFEADGPIQRWISLWIGTDVVPLLVHACSDRCVDALPRPPGYDHHRQRVPFDESPYVDHPHEGGRELAQLPTDSELWVSQRERDLESPAETAEPVSPPTGPRAIAIAVPARHTLVRSHGPRPGPNRDDQGEGVGTATPTLPVGGRAGSLMDTGVLTARQTRVRSRNSLACARVRAIGRGGRSGRGAGLRSPRVLSPEQMRRRRTSA